MLALKSVEACEASGALLLATRDYLKLFLLGRAEQHSRQSTDIETQKSQAQRGDHLHEDTLDCG